MQFPATYEYPQARYFTEYLNFEADENLFDVFEKIGEAFDEATGALTDLQANFAYGPDKWTIKQVIGHIIDTERIFAYRCLAIARGEKQALPGYDENTYMAHAGYENQTLADVLKQYHTCRQATLALFMSLHETQWNQMGNANGHNISARALAWMIAGHEKHHLNVIRERYLPQIS